MAETSGQSVGAAQTVFVGDGTTVDRAAGSGVLRSAWPYLIIVGACYALAFTDRQIVNLLVEPMKRDYGITDAQAGFVLGPAFTLSYVSVGLFAGYCADRFSRRNLILCAGMVWGMATIATAFMHSYQGIVATRILVGGSEAFLFPAGMSLVADMFDRRRLPVATTLFLIFPYIGGGLAMLMGGMVMGLTADVVQIAVPPLGIIRGWQIPLAVVGLAGLVPIIAMLVVREPVRGGTDRVAGGSLSFAQGVAYMAKRWRFFAMFFFGLSGTSLMLNTIPAWVPTMFVREYGMHARDVGVVYGILVLVCGVVGGLIAPLGNAWLARRYSDSTMRFALSGPLLMAVAGAILPFTHQRWTTLACIAAITLGYSSALPMAGASLQLATPPRLRGLAAAFYFVIVTIIAMGIGPMLVPVTTHLLGNPKMIREALGIITVVFATISWLMLLVALVGFRIERGITNPRIT